MRLTILALSVLILAACTAQAAPEPDPPAAPSRIPQRQAAAVRASAGPTAAPTLTPPLAGFVAASVYRHGHWDIYLLGADGRLLKRLTFGEGDNRAPAWSPDGSRITFESSRNHNWDLYVINADGSNLRRLTTDAHFDGSPRWSPDGSQMAFTSDRDGDLDIWIMKADGSNPVNITPKTPEPDYDPAWSPNGTQIAFTSMRDGNKEIYLMNADGTQPRNVTQQKATDEEHPAWSPDGARLAFVSERLGARELFALDITSPQVWQRLTALSYDQWPVWSPDGSRVMFVAQSEASQPLQVVLPGQSYVAAVTHDDLLYRQPDWSVGASVTLDAASLQRDDLPLYVEKTTPNAPSRADRYNLVDLQHVKVIVPKLSDTVDDSFEAWRRRVLLESGIDFLGALSEAARPLTYTSDESDYLSWHKAGRAVDLLWDLFTDQGHALEVAREDVLGETYWRMYLRAARQDGSQGEPLREIIWDVSDGARRRANGRGGLIKGVLPGNYVDITELGRQYGWRRISSNEKADFDWHRDFKALEYWHYQKTDGMAWWTAIQEIYTPQELGNLFRYEALVKAKYSLLAMMVKGIPMPADVLQRLRTLEP
ncbi:MAG: PD40 domain-containing protein [Chloroflexi bacterium]|nr:PD40 domain-containing protein [Chloroflexota bacterium]